MNSHKSDKTLLAKFPELKPELEQTVQIIKNYEQSTGKKISRGIPYSDQIGKEFEDQKRKLEKLHIITVEADCHLIKNSVCFMASTNNFNYTKKEGEKNCEHICVTTKYFTWFEKDNLPTNAQKVESLDDYDAQRYEKLQKGEILAAYRHIEGNWYIFYKLTHSGNRCDSEMGGY